MADTRWLLEINKKNLKTDNFTLFLQFGGFSGRQRLFWDVNLLIICGITKYKMTNTRWRPENNKKNPKTDNFMLFLPFGGFWGRQRLF